MKELKNRFYKFGEFRLDARERTLSKDNEIIPINFKSFDVLLALVQNSGRLLEKEELMRLVWTEAIVEEANLKNCVSALRKALGDTPNQSLYIQTLPKLGYKFVAPVQTVADEKEEWIVERHTLTEVVIEKETIAISEDELQIETAFDEHSLAMAKNAVKGELQSATEADFESETSATPSPIVAHEAQNLSRPFSTHKKWFAVLAATLLLGIGALVVYKLFYTSKAKPAFTFDKMKMSKLHDIGSGFSYIAPDGKYLVYAVESQAGKSIWLKHLETNVTTQLLPNGVRAMWGVCFSQDSQKFYFTIADEQNPAGALYEFSPEGATSKKLFDGINSKVSLSPDNKRLIYRRFENAMGRNMLVAVNLDGTDEQVLLPPSVHYVIWDCAWSPSGKTITILLLNLNEDGSRSWQIAELPAAGGAIKPITQPQKEAITSFSWLPDESALMITAREASNSVRQLWLVSYPDGSKQKLTNDLNDYNYVIVTDSGKSIFTTYANFASTVWIADSQDANKAQKVNVGSGYFRDLHWTTDNQILYDNAGDVWMMSPDGSNHRRLTADAGSNLQPNLSATDKTLVFLSNRSGRFQVWRMEEEGSNPKQLTNVPNDATSPQISPDGRWVFYSAWLPVGWTVWKVPIDGGNAMQLTFQDTKSWAVSPDGKELVYAVYDEAKKRDLFAFKSTQGGEPTRFYDFPTLESYSLVQWKKAGLYCSNKGNTEIFLLPVDGGKPKPVSNFNTGEALDFSISPDGGKIVFARITASNQALLITDFR
jgi:DNA-binding winged helix-turn-helix (wHTH) protein/Tol biopolymer transport system component